MSKSNKAWAQSNKAVSQQNKALSQSKQTESIPEKENVKPKVTESQTEKKNGHHITAVSRNCEFCGKFTFTFRKNFYL